MMNFKKMKLEDLSVKHNYHCSSESDEVNYYSFDNLLLRDMPQAS